MKIILFFSLIFVLGCTVANKNYSYKIVTYTIQNEVRQELPFIQHLISYQGMLLEFNVGVTTIDSVNILSKNSFSRYTYDTLSVYLLNPEDRLFYEFSEFSLNSKLTSHGKFSNKKFGIKLHDSTSYSNFVISGKIKDTIFFGNQKVIYVETIERDVYNKDSILTKVFFIKDANFRSMYELQMGKSLDKNYTMVAFSNFIFKEKYEIIGALEQLRILSEEEEKICRRMLKMIREIPIGKSEYFF